MAKKVKQVKVLRTVFIDMELDKQIQNLATALGTGVSLLVERWLQEKYQDYLAEEASLEEPEDITALMEEAV